MGIVYLARDPKIDRQVAIKVLGKDRIGSETFVKRFLKEARAIGRLSHPDIVTIYDVGEDHETAYIAMEYLEGCSLSDIIKERCLDIPELVDIGVQIAETLNYAHQQGVIHRDIKPSNIVVRKDGKVTITDFGVAHFDDSSATMQTQTGTIIGTPAYMSPEQVQGNPIDGRSDLFSLGIILYEMSTGKIPFGGKGKGIATVLSEIVLIIPQEPHISASLIPMNISRIIMKSLEKEPDKRFQSGKDLAEALKKSITVDENANKVPVRRGNALRYVIPAAIIVAIIAGSGVFLQDKLKSPEKDAAKLTGTSAPSLGTNTLPSGRTGQKPGERNMVVQPSPMDKGDHNHDSARYSNTPGVDTEKKQKKGQQDSLVIRKPSITRESPNSVPASTLVPVKEQVVGNVATGKAVISRVLIYVKTEPIKSTISLDEYKVESGRELASFFVPLGRHKLRIVHQNYEPYEEEIFLDEKDLQRQSRIIDRRLRPMMRQSD